jgi:hypothetical protein
VLGVFFTRRALRATNSRRGMLSGRRRTVSGEWRRRSAALPLEQVDEKTNDQVDSEVVEAWLASARGDDRARRVAEGACGGSFVSWGKFRQVEQDRGRERQGGRRGVGRDACAMAKHGDDLSRRCVGRVCPRASRIAGGAFERDHGGALAYLAEVEERGLHLREACSSLFAFCVERLHLSEGAAAKRVWAARTARRFPLVLKMIASGEIHLSGVHLLTRHLTEENHVELLARARHRSKREIEKLIAEIAPKPDVASRVTALSRRQAEMEVGSTSVAEPNGAVAVQEEHAPEPVAVPSCAPRAIVAPLSERRYLIRVTVGEETHAALGQLQDLLSHQVPDRDPAVIIARALDLLLERTLAVKAAVCERPRTGKEPAKRNRHVPASVRRQVWKRDGAQCAFIDGEGRRCRSTRFLEFHHTHNWGRGAEHEPGQIELRCRAHNQYQAELDYGAQLMADRRSRAREPGVEYGGYRGREVVGDRDRERDRERERDRDRSRDRRARRTPGGCAAIPSLRRWGSGRIRRCGGPPP